MRTTIWAGALLVTGLAASSALAIGDDTMVGEQAERNKSVAATKIVCEDFLVLSEQRQAAVAWYVEGFSRNGKVEDEEVGYAELDRPVADLVEACKKQPKATVFSVLKSDWKKIEKKI
jgi:acid stress chaperone HdeA